MSSYVEPGYVESGYFEGDSVLSIPPGPIALRFFIAQGATAVEDAIKNATPGSGEIAVVYMPDAGKTVLFDGENTAVMVGAPSQDEIIAAVSTPTYVNMVAQTVQNSVSVNMSACIKDSGGSIVSDATVRRIDNTTFEVEIPQNLVGTQYRIVLGEQC
ncbi:hypothetical protein [Nitratifractor sp.]